MLKTQVADRARLIGRREGILSYLFLVPCSIAITLSFAFNYNPTAQVLLLLFGLMGLIGVMMYMSVEHNGCLTLNNFSDIFNSKSEIENFALSEEKERLEKEIKAIKEREKIEYSILELKTEIEVSKGNLERSRQTYNNERE